MYVYAQSQRLRRPGAASQSVGYAVRFDTNILTVHSGRTVDRVTVNQELRLAVSISMAKSRSMTKSRIRQSVRMGGSTEMPLTKRWKRMSRRVSLARILPAALALTLLTTGVAPSTSFAEADARDQRP